MTQSRRSYFVPIRIGDSTREIDLSNNDIDDDEVAKLFADLSDREKHVLEERFGVDLSGGTNQEVVAAMLEITREKIEGIERKALKKLRNRDDD